MRIHKLILHNIRSYAHEEITIPEGSVLLSGDIGCGKSSLLLAIEFAIFGLLRGQLDGTALLRHGKEEGYVELHAKINEQDVQIKRTLKRTQRGITQGPGSLILNGQEETLTAQELKARMLNLLGYPQDLVTKSKSLIFRYTVYTPQEEMKSILFDEGDTRMNTLRRVFNIDKYKRIKENTSIYTKVLRERKKLLEGRLQDLPKKIERYALTKTHFEKGEEALRILLPKLSQIQSEKAAIASQAKMHEEKVKQLQSLKHKLDLSEQRIKHNVKSKMDLEQEHTVVSDQITLLKKDIPQNAPDHATIAKAIQETKQKQTILEKEISSLNQQMARLSAHIQHSQKTKEKFQSNSCPYCLQEVQPDHKEKMLGEENTKIKEHAKKQAQLTQELTTLKTKHEQHKKDLEHLAIQEKEAALITIKKQNVAKEESRLENLKARKVKHSKEMDHLKKEREEILTQIHPLENAEHEAKDTQTKFQTLTREERDLALRVTAAKKEQEHITSTLQELEKEIKALEHDKTKHEKLQLREHWLSAFFSELMELMEKHVLLTVYHQFNGLFQEWFTLLMEQETMQARLNDNFAPIIEIDGYETELKHLSGGEKTSCALAYRLALNRVINDVISNMHTKDLIILDEPTDGFSSEQLDRVRQVLDELQMRQIILVSHEPKVESFVDTVLRVQKSSHESQVFEI